MKTWQAIVINLGLIFGTTYAVKIKDPDLQKAVLGSIAVLAGGAAKVNSESDQGGNKLPPLQ